MKKGEFNEIINDMMEKGEVNDFIEDSIDKCVKKIVDDLHIGNCEENLVDSGSGDSSPKSCESNIGNEMVSNISFNIQPIQINDGVNNEKLNINPDRVKIPFTVFSNRSSFIGGNIP